MANPKSTTPVIIVKQLKISSTGVLGTMSPLPTVVTCRQSTALSHKLAYIFLRLAALSAITCLTREEDAANVWPESDGTSPAELCCGFSLAHGAVGAAVAMA